MSTQEAARGARCSDGFTIVEVLVAMVLAVTVMGAAAAMFATQNHSALAGGRQVQLLSLAQQQLETVRQDVVRYGFQDLFMTAAPGAPDASIPADPMNPNDYVNTSSSPSSYFIEENYNSNGGNLSGNVATGTPPAGEPLVIGTPSVATPGISPMNTSVPTGGGGSATVYTYITQVSDVCNATFTSGLGGSACSTAGTQQDVRRVVVAVVYNNAFGQTPTAPEYATTIISNPVPSNQVSVANGIHIGVNVGAAIGVGS
jgi:type II secretory pathway pseudopilin PulG